MSASGGRGDYVPPDPRYWRGGLRSNPPRSLWRASHFSARCLETRKREVRAAGGPADSLPGSVGQEVFFPRGAWTRHFCRNEAWKSLGELGANRPGTTQTTGLQILAASCRAPVPAIDLRRASQSSLFSGNSMGMVTVISEPPSGEVFTWKPPAILAAALRMAGIQGASAGLASGPA